MSDLQEKYHEHLLHWIWESLHFELTDLRTTCGRSITVLDKGTQNKTDGPDFRNARLQVGELQWYGDIEFHWSVNDWIRHHHHTDPRYNRVILHVVYHPPEDLQISREDETNPFTLHLKPHLPPDLDQLLSAYNQTEELPCAGHIHHISDEVLEQQFEQAHREYFESKTDVILKRYDPSLPPARAWKKALALGLFDGLGISQNREPMLDVGKKLYSDIEETDDLNQPPSLSWLQKRAYGVAGLDEESRASAIIWNRKGCRPTNRPEVRLDQAVMLMWQIENRKLNDFYGNDPEETWQQLLAAINTETGIGRQRSDILYGIVFLPALWLLGNLFHITSLKQTAFDCWMNHDAQIPTSLFALFEQSGIPIRLYQKKLGAVYQLKHYCKPRRCNECHVLKVLISS